MGALWICIVSKFSKQQKYVFFLKEYTPTFRFVLHINFPFYHAKFCLTVGRQESFPYDLMVLVF